MMFQRQRRRRLAASKDGSVAIEFALVAPFLFIFYFSAISVFDLIRAARQASHTTSVVCDLSSRVAAMDDGIRDSLFSASGGLMTMWDDPNDYSVSITSIVNPADPDDDPDLEVAWSEASITGRELTTDDLAGYELPTIEDGASVILVEVQADHTLFFSVGALDGKMRINRMTILRPRFGATVPYNS